MKIHSPDKKSSLGIDYRRSIFMKASVGDSHEMTAGFEGIIVTIYKGCYNV